MIRAFRIFSLCLGLTAATVFLGGCNVISASDIRSDPTPELYTQNQTRDQYLNMQAIHVHHAWRSARDDWSRIWLYDKNTELTPWPVP